MTTTREGEVSASTGKALMALLLSNTTSSGRPLGIVVSGYQLCGLGWAVLFCLGSTFFDR